MGGKPDYIRKKYAPMLDKSLTSALAHRIGQDFPRMGGERIRHVCAQMVLEVVNSHLHPAEHVHHGQVLWLAISIDDPPSRGKKIRDTDLVPVLLDLHVEEDITARLQRKGMTKQLEQKAVRLCRQAFEQGGLLSNCDLAELLSTQDSRIAHILTDYQRRTNKLVPRRATIHDVGTGLTHKNIICRKRFIDGLSSEEIARETHHSIEAVDRYLGHYDRVLHCKTQGLSPQETAQILNCSLNLVAQYLAIADDLDVSRLNTKGAN
jgi:DNA-binding CsgD family transcriptional regulator